MPIEIVDCHFHFYDKKANTHSFLEQYDSNLARMWGAFYQTKMPNAYQPSDYFEDMRDYNVTHLVMAELVSADPLKEMHFAQDIASNNKRLSAAIANIDLLDPNLADLLAEYAKIPIVRSVRDHLLWDPSNSQRCYTRRADILSEPAVANAFTKIQKYPFTFEFEIYAHEIPQVLRYAKQFPGINFALHCMGWPLNQSSTGFQRWKHDMQALSQCKNVFVKITAIECVFGLDWTVDQISPWINTTIALFGSDRCMFGSHLPIAKLSHGVTALYDGYQAVTTHLTSYDKQNLFADTAKHFYAMRPPSSPFV